MCLVDQRSVILHYMYGLCILVLSYWNCVESSNSCFCTFFLHQISLYFSLPFIINILFYREHVMPLRTHSRWDTSKNWWSNHHWNFSGPKYHFNHRSEGLLLGENPVISLVYKSVFILLKRLFQAIFSFRTFV